MPLEVKTIEIATQSEEQVLFKFDNGLNIQLRSDMVKNALSDYITAMTTKHGAYVVAECEWAFISLNNKPSE